MFKKSIIFYLLIIFCWKNIYSANSSATMQNFSISAGTINGIYYSVGGTICRLTNKNKMISRIKCSLEATPATIFNINMLREEKTDFGIMQSDWEYYAMKGQGYFEKFGSFEDLRSLFSMHKEVFALVVRKNSDIKTLDDIQNKRVNLNSAGSGVSATMNSIFKLKNWNKNSFKLITQLKESEQGQALCDNKVDAVGYFVGHPNAGLQELSAICDIRIISVYNDPTISQMIQENDFYFEALIPGGLYNGISQDVKSYGVYANFMTRANVDEEIVYHLTKSVFENINNFRLSHKLLSELDVKKMATMGYSAPLHPGAKKYYMEIGLLTELNLNNE